MGRRAAVGAGGVHDLVKNLQPSAMSLSRRIRRCKGRKQKACERERERERRRESGDKKASEIQKKRKKALESKVN